MKKFRTTITTKTGEKTVIVWIDDETATLLNQMEDGEQINQYLQERHKENLNEHKETRRHQSLEKSTEKGFDIVDENQDFEDSLIEIDYLHNAMKKLTVEQREVIMEYYFKDKTCQEIANEKRVSPQAVAQQLKRAIQRLKNIFKNF